MNLIRTAIFSITLSGVFLTSCRGPYTSSTNQENLSMSQQRTISLQFLQQDAIDTERPLTYTFVDERQAEGLIYLTYQWKHADWFILTHNLVEVIYDPSTGQARWE